MAARSQPKHVFLNVPFDGDYAPLYVAEIAALTALGLTPRAVLEIPPHDDARLERLKTLMRTCGASIHDLSRVELSKARGLSPVPRFNMPFELGLTLGLHASGHRWFVFESEPHRVARSLSDLGGYDAISIHDGTAEGATRAVHNAFRSDTRKVKHDDLVELHEVLGVFAKRVAKEHGTLFNAIAFEELVLAGQEAAKTHFGD